MSFVNTPLNIYMVETLNAEPQMQNTIGILQTLPWSMKLIFGFMSDAFPMFGLHRKPYLTMGALLYSTAFILYAVCRIEHVAWLAICIFVATVGLIQMDVMADTMCVERSKFECDKTRGQMQASYYSIRFGGGLLGAIAGASVCNKDTWGWGLTFNQVALVNGLIPFILVVPWLFPLREKYKAVHHYHLVHHHKDGTCTTEDYDKPVDIKLEMVELGKLNQMNVGNSPGGGKKTKGSKGSAYSKDLQARSDASTPTETTSLTSSYNSKTPSYTSSPAQTNPAESLYRGANQNTKNPIRQTVQEQTKNMSLVTATDGTEGDHDYVVDEVEPLAIHSDEPDTTPTIRQQLQEIWETVQLQAVWRPMAFVYIFNLLQIPNVAWQSYLQLSLNFPAYVLGLSVILGSFMTFAGTVAYKHFFFKTSWRLIYVWTMALTTFFSLLQLVLIFQLNQYLGLSNYFFSVGDDVISAYISGIQFLPLCIMYMRLCPEGAEGASYSMLTTFGNIALVCSSNLGNLFANIWDVSNDAMEAHDVSGLWKLSLLTSALSIIPLSLLFLLPRSAEEQDELSKSKVRSKLGGGIFLTVLFGSLLWTVITAIMHVNDNS